MISRQRDEHAAEACAIMLAIRELHANPRLLNLARSDLPSALDRLGLAGTARHAVAATLAITLGAGFVLIPGTPFFWSA